MILEAAMLDAVRAHFQSLQHEMTLLLGQGEHEKRQELQGFLQQIASTSDKIHVGETQDLDGISFAIAVNGEKTGIVFSGIPGGHEFSSLILALLQAGGGSSIKLDESLQHIIKNIQQTLVFETFISLSCHNCPDVVQALNQFALLNPLISSRMIDGGLYAEEIARRNIQGVPTVYLNGELFANGKIDTAKLIERLLEKYPEIGQSASPASLPLQDVAVIGGGPAGVAAAIYAARKGLNVVLVADRIGGQVKDTVDIENFIATVKTTGSALAQQLQTHLREYPIKVKENQRVTQVTRQEKRFVLQLNTGEVLESRSVIVASGAKWRELGVKGEKENIGNGVAFCPHCDGPFFAGKDIAVIGGGNSGVEAALDLAGIVKHVTLLEFMPNLKADHVLIEQLHKRDNIRVITSAAVQEILAENGKVNALRYLERESDTEKRLDVAGIFVQIGLLPNSDCVADLVERTAFGEIVVNAKCETNIEGVFAAGDVTTVPYKQIVIAMGEGAKAALSAFEYLLRQD